MRHPIRDEREGADRLRNQSSVARFLSAWRRWSQPPRRCGIDRFGTPGRLLERARPSSANEDDFPDRLWDEIRGEGPLHLANAIHVTRGRARPLVASAVCVLAFLGAIVLLTRYAAAGVPIAYVVESPERLPIVGAYAALDLVRDLVVHAAATTIGLVIAWCYFRRHPRWSQILIKVVTLPVHVYGAVATLVVVLGLAGAFDGWAKWPAAGVLYSAVGIFSGRMLWMLMEWAVDGGSALKRIFAAGFFAALGAYYVLFVVSSWTWLVSVITLVCSCVLGMWGGRVLRRRRARGARMLSVGAIFAAVGYLACVVLAGNVASQADDPSGFREVRLVLDGETVRGIELGHDALGVTIADLPARHVATIPFGEIQRRDVIDEDLHVPVESKSMFVRLAALF